MTTIRPTSSLPNMVNEQVNTVKNKKNGSVGTWVKDHKVALATTAIALSTIGVGAAVAYSNGITSFADLQDIVTKWIPGKTTLPPVEPPVEPPAPETFFEMFATSVNSVVEKLPSMESIKTMGNDGFKIGSDAIGSLNKYYQPYTSGLSNLSTTAMKAVSDENGNISTTSKVVVGGGIGGTAATTALVCYLMNRLGRTLSFK